jgi:hypothetical protein
VLTYWMMFLLPAWAAVVQARIRAAPRLGPEWLAAWLALTLLIGYRFEVGADWGSYVDAVYSTSGRSLAEILSGGDPAYGLLNWLAWQFGWGIHGVNLICGALFGLGLIVFCRQQPRPWLAMAVAMPYLVIVVAMGYSRQGVAIGLAMLGLAALSHKSNLRFVAWVALASLFHKSAVVLLPLAIVATRQGRWLTAAWVGATAAAMFALVLEAHTDTLVRTYLAAEYASEGAAVRVAMNAAPALVFLIFRRRLAPDGHLRRLWTWMALVALASVLLLAISPSSTAVDRIALYLIPLQMFVFGRLPDLGGSDRAMTNALVASTLVFYGLVLAVWLNYASHAFAWLPYRFFPLEPF